MAKIEFDTVYKSFQDTPALCGLTLSVPEGSVYGLVGPNGAGKTTAIRHMTGMIRPDSGEVRLCGEPVFENRSVKERMVCIGDEPWYFGSASVRDMLGYYKALYPRFDMARFEKLREAYPLDDKRPIRRMSRGMQKQSAFWLALSARPEILILDEPVDGLDPVMRRQTWSLVLGDVAEYGTTVLVSSHNLRELEDVCDHVGIVSKGKCLLEKPLSSLQENTVKVLAAFDGTPALPEELKVLHRSATGRLNTLICRGSAEEAAALLQPLSPVFLDCVPLTLEEIFIYELGGADYAVKDILL